MTVYEYITQTGTAQSKEAETLKNKKGRKSMKKIIFGAIALAVLAGGAITALCIKSKLASFEKIDTECTE